MTKDKPTKTTKPDKPIDYKSMYQLLVTTNVKESLSKLTYFYVCCDKGHIITQDKLITLDIADMKSGLAFCLIVNQKKVEQLTCPKCKKDKALEKPVMDSAKKKGE